MPGIHKTKIEWCDATWNPISGCLGPGGGGPCGYCYAKQLARRFGPHPSEWPEPGASKEASHDPRCFVAERPTVLRDADGNRIRSTAWPRGFAPTLHAYALGYPQAAKRPRSIFVGSMADMFGDWVPDEWLAAVFRECLKAPQHVYLFLTKNPARYVRLAESGLLPEGDNYWYGTTLTGSGGECLKYTGERSFISIEPLLGEFRAADMWGKVGWAIVGAESGPGAGKHKPKQEWILQIVYNCRYSQTPVFLKDSLAPYWHGELPQEYPQKMMAHLEGKRGGPEQ